MNPAASAKETCAPGGLALAPPPEPHSGPDPAETARWFQREVAPHEGDLRAYLRARFPSLSDLDDLIQETYARLFRVRGKGELREVRPYLFATARNVAIDMWRHRQVVAFEQVGDLERLAVVEEGPNAAEIASRNQEVDLLHEAIRTLPERCRQVLVLRRFHGWSHRAIARKLGIAEKTVDAHLVHAVYRCRNYLREQGISAARLQAARPVDAPGRTP